MANDDKQTGANLASSGVVLAALVAAGTTYFAGHEAPLRGSRPAMTEPQFHQSVTGQDIDARLWQDPFAAIAKTIEKAPPGESERCRVNAAGAAHCVSPLAQLAEETRQRTLMLAVTMPGAPYAEDAEVRRRTRYAVSSSLERAGFVPRDERHLGYFRPWHKDVRLPEVVPFEWFASKEADPRQSRYVLVLWVNEDALRGSPLKRLTSLAAVLRHSNSRPEIPIRVVGPYSSGTLLDMAKELGSDDGTCVSPQKLQAEWQGKVRSMSFYAYGATVDDKELFKQVQQCDDTPQDSSVHDFFKNRGISLYRTVATDAVLARGIVAELKLRNIEPGKARRKNPQDVSHVALISEWDTFYGQTLPDTVERAFPDPNCPPEKDCKREWVHRLTYMRGLDGQLPRGQESAQKKSGGGTPEAGKEAGIANFFKADSDAPDADRPNGQGQQDYLRRLADSLRKLNDGLRRERKGGISAIGILGSDVFDKLLVLRALRPEFPEALFFTTDFDATLTMPSELDFTRNLIISSSFGPQLRQEIQAEIPPFRGSYQAAAFLAAGLATGDPANNWCARVGQKNLDRWLSRPQIIEIERTGGLLPFPAQESLPGSIPPPETCPEPAQPENIAVSGDSLPMQAGFSVSGTCSDLKDLASCKDIQPPDEDLYPDLENSDLIAGTLGGAALLVLLMLGIPRMRERAGVELGLVALTLGAAALACYFWEELAGWLTQDGRGEPIALLQGVSIWPTVLLRMLSVVLSIYLLWAAWRKLDENLNEIAHEMNLPPPNLAIAAEREVAAGQSQWKKFRRMFSYGLREHQPDPRKPYYINVAWSEYVYQERWVAQLLRVALYTAVMFCLWHFVIAPVFGQAFSPRRGAHAKEVLKYASRIEIISLLAMMYLVFDATWLCLRFVKELCRSSPAWPQTMTKFENRLGLEQQFLAKWIDLDFVARRTSCILTLIYYPFILIALVLVTRSTVFANYNIANPKILAFQGACLAIVFGCAIALCWTAQAMRSAAKQQVMDGIIRAKGPCANELDDGGRRAGQLEALAGRIDGLCEGAFSPLAQQPLVRALLLPAGSLSWTTLLEHGMLPGL